MAIYDSAVEAIFLCFLVDQEENDGDSRPYYASAALQRYMERHRPVYRLPSSNPGSRSEEHAPYESGGSSDTESSVRRA